MNSYTSEPDGSNNVKVNGPLVSGGNVLLYFYDYFWAPDSSKIIYIADQDTDGIHELYASYPTTSTGNIKLNGPLGAGFVEVHDGSMEGTMSTAF